MKKKLKKHNKSSSEAKSFPVVEVPKSTVLGPLRDISPMTEAQEDVFQAFDAGKHLILSGAAGCGKTFLSMYLAMKKIAEEGYKRKLIIIRSVVPTRDMGFLPGTQEDKEAAYIIPYQEIIAELYRDQNAWKMLIDKGLIQFVTTSFLRGRTLNKAVILVDEFQNCNFHECDTVITRLGKDTQSIFAGDYYQSDFEKEKDRNGILEFLKIIDRIKSFEHIEFTFDDCVRNGIVREYLKAKEEVCRKK